MIYVTGGAGYIGAHTCAELLASSYEVVVFDNFCNSQREAVVQPLRSMAAYKVVSRRDGDFAACYADPSLAARQLSWRVQRDLTAVCAYK